jgi:hypothetical protein
LQATNNQTLRPAESAKFVELVGRVTGACAKITTRWSFVRELAALQHSPLYPHREHGSVVRTRWLLLTARLTNGREGL